MYKIIWVDDFVGETYEQEFETKREAKKYVKKICYTRPGLFSWNWRKWLCGLRYARVCWN